MAPPARENKPIIVVQYQKEEDKYKREEPTMKKISISKSGVLGIGFSDPMVFPDTWKEKFEADSKANGSTARKLKRGGTFRKKEKEPERIPFLDAQLKLASDGSIIDIP